MESFAVYLLKSAVWLTGFSLVYFLFLRNERFFKIKRGYLVAGIIASLVFPLITFHYFAEIPAPGLSTAETVTASSIIFPAGVSINDGFKLNYKHVLLFIYVLGIILLTIRILKQINKLSEIIRKSDSSTRGFARIIRVHGFTSPFSFLNYVFISPAVEPDEAEQILNHEEVHIRQKHWFDLLLAEIIRLLQWANPFAWIYAGFIRQNHEYLADEAALQLTPDPSRYRAALLNQMFNVPVIHLTNSFSYSNGKKRFDMMKRIISSPWRKLRILFVLPVAAFIFYAFATPEYKYTSTNSDGTVKGKVLNEENKPMFGVKVTFSDGSASMITNEEGNFTMLNVPEKAALVFTFPGFKSLRLNAGFDREMIVKMTKDQDVIPAELKIVPPPAASPGQSPEQPLWIVDGVIRTDKEWIDPNTISSISILKDESATSVFGEKGLNGVVIVTTKKAVRSDQVKNVSGKVLTIDGKPLGGATIQIKGTTVGTTSDSDGLFRLTDVTGDAQIIVSYIGFKTISVRPDFVSEMMIKVPRDTMRLSNINVPPPPPPPPSTADKGITNRAEKGDKPLYIVDGKIRNDISDMSTDSIKTVNVHKGEKYIEKYGEKAKNGVIEIVTKRKSQDDNNAMIIVEEMPSFSGGEQALRKWIYGNLSIPGSIDRSKLKDPVDVIFIVSSTGKIDHVRVVKSVHPLLDAEAIRVVSSMPDWSPGKQNGKPVDVYYMLPITFNLR